MFLDHGISAAEAQRMTDVEFEMTLNGFLDERSHTRPSRSPSVPRPAHRSFYEDMLADQRNLDEDEALRMAQALSLAEAAPYVDLRERNRRSASVAPARPNPKPTPLPKPAPKPKPSVDPRPAATKPRMIQKRIETRVEPIDIGSRRSPAGEGTGPRKTPISGVSGTRKTPIGGSGMKRPGVASRAPKRPALDRPEDNVKMRVEPRRPAMTVGKKDTVPVSRRVPREMQPRGTAHRTVEPQNDPADFVPGLEGQRAQQRRDAASARKQKLDKDLQEMEARRRSPEEVGPRYQDENEQLEAALRMSLAEAQQRNQREENDQLEAALRMSLAEEDERNERILKQQIEAAQKKSSVEMKRRNDRVMKEQIEAAKKKSSAEMKRRNEREERAQIEAALRMSSVEEEQRNERLLKEQMEEAKRRSLQDVRRPAVVADPTPTKPKSDAETEAARVLTASQRIRKDQDDEYQNAILEQQQREREAEEQRRREEEEQRRQEQQQLNREDELQTKFKALPAEPATGTAVAVQMNGKRLQRKFDPQAKGEVVYVWIAGQTLESDEKLFLDSFILKTATGAAIAKEEPLDAQGVTGRVMVVIDEL